MALDDRAVAWLLASQLGVLSRNDALSCGLTLNAIRHRIQPGGAWQRLLPGVYLTATGEPTRDQILTAAMLYAGPVSIITGPAALSRQRISVPRTSKIDVLVPASRKRTSRAFVVVHRTRRMPRAFTVDGRLKFALPARAVTDTVRGLTNLSDARAVVASAVQQGRCSIQQIGAELAAGPTRGSARLRSVLAEVIAGVRSVPEADFRDLIKTSGLPLPLFNPSLYLHGEFLAKPDAWWPAAGVVAEVDSAEWHLSPADWEQTMRRHDRLAAAGLIVLHFSPRQLRTEPRRLLRDIADALQVGRPVTGIETRAAAA